MSRKYCVWCVGVVFVVAFGGCAAADSASVDGDRLDAGGDRKVEGPTDAQSEADVTKDVTQDTNVGTGGVGGTGGTSDSGNGGSAGVGATSGGGGSSHAGAGGDAEGGGGASTGGTGGFGGVSSGGTAGAGGNTSECTPNTTEDKSCGTCNSGKSTRVCDSSGIWGAWGACAGENTGFPYKPNTNTPVCPPYHRPAVFFSPHADDESIGMAGALQQHVEAGRQVFVELMSHGTATSILKNNVLGNGKTCPWHPGKHEYTLTPEQFGKARVAEFTAAVASLGVTGIYVSDFPDSAVKASDVKTRIDWWIATKSSEMALKGVAGRNDPGSGGFYHNDHVAMWDALISSGFKDIRGYLIYHYTSNAGTGFVTASVTSYLPGKKKALDAYKKWDPASGRYGIGYHSVPDLIDKAATTSYEYVVKPELLP